jgi:hypothetical protein
MTQCPVIARRAAPWQSRLLCDRRWIASFLAMTGRGRNDGAGSAMTGPGRHAEAAANFGCRESVGFLLPVPAE